ncbi:MAG TPA: response regulator [Flavobacteriales bacterium]|nr:response regulator [Flavobacteriales bacterium]
MQVGAVSGRMPHVVLIEDDALVRKLLEKRLLGLGWQVTALRDGRELMATIHAHPADLILIDLGLPHVDGLTLVEELRGTGVKAPILVLTAYDLPHLHATVRSTGADDLVQKPYDQEELIERMRRLLAA